MSSLVTPSTVTCPRCGSLLVTDDVVGDGNVICAHCREAFIYKSSLAAARMSRKAVASLVLAIASLLFFCLAAIPAIILGVLALVDLHRHENLRGRRVAVAGILLSIFCGFLSLIVWALLLPALQKL